MAKLKDGCVTPVKGPMQPKIEQVTDSFKEKVTEVKTMLAKVGKEAIDFEATAFVQDIGFKNIKLSNYKGKWIVICFYPGDFTFV